MAGAAVFTAGVAFAVVALAAATFVAVAFALLAFVVVGEFGAGPVEVGAPSFALAAPEILTAW